MRKTAWLCLGGALLAGVVALIVFGWTAVRVVQGPSIVQGETDLRFQEIPFPRVHEGDLDASLSAMGISAIDIDGDGIDEIFSGGGHGQADALFRYTKGGFVPVETGDSFGKQDLDATFGAASIDATGDGLDDLFVARESGVYFYQNREGGAFTGGPIEFGLADNTTPLSVALGDINQDGWVDLYISGYIKIELMEGETNFDVDYGGYSYLLLNNGDNTWADISRSAGVFRRHNTFVAMFVDFDNDGRSDIAVAQDTGVVETWRNRGDLSFERIDNPTVFSYPMGLGAGDIDNDGYVDLYLSNVGTTLPTKLVRGNLTGDQPFNKDYMLLKNNRGSGFSDIAAESNAARYGFGWGTVITDFNNDGRMDLYAAQNYARFPGVKYLDLYPGRLLLQYEDRKFQAVESVAGIENKNFGFTEVVSDFNQDGWPDMVIGNLTGPVRAFMNSGGGRHRLTVRLPNSPGWLNTRVSVTTPDGTVLTRQLFASEGLCSDQTDALFFGLGNSSGPVRVEVHRPGADVRAYSDVAIDSVLRIGR